MLWFRGGDSCFFFKNINIRADVLGQTVWPFYASLRAQVPGQYLANPIELAWLHMRAHAQADSHFLGIGPGFSGPLLNVVSKTSVSLSKVFHFPEKPQVLPGS